jgi:hypothetical protein
VESTKKLPSTFVGNRLEKLAISVGTFSYYTDP